MMGSVYIFEVPKLHCIKVGWSGTICGVDNRLRATQTYMPADVTMLAHFPGSKAAERWLHNKLAKLHIRGEWFVRTPEIVKAAKLIDAAYQNPDGAHFDWRTVFKSIKPGARRWNPHRWHRRFDSRHNERMVAL